MTAGQGRSVKYLVDTDWIVDYLYGNPQALRVKRKSCRENAINLYGLDL